MKSKSSQAHIKMPDSEIRVGIEAAKKPASKKASGPPLKEINTKQGSKLEKPVSGKQSRPKNLPKRKK